MRSKPHVTSASPTSSAYLNVKRGSGIGDCGGEGQKPPTDEVGAGSLSGVPPVIVDMDIDQGSMIRPGKSMPIVAIRMIASMLDAEELQKPQKSLNAWIRSIGRRRQPGACGPRLRLAALLPSVPERGV